MRLLPTPTDDQAAVFALCINSISNMELRNRLEAISLHFNAAAQDYFARGQLRQLYLIPAVNLKDDAIVVGAVTKAELKSAYSDHMVGKGKPAREIYDRLILSAPFRRCPYCGIGHTTTLDHYLPKAKFPLLSVVTLNLVPSCKDCNTDKRISFATTETEQTLHPYFEQNAVIDEQWLYAHLNQSNPPVLEFFVSAPAHWPNILKDRVAAHFTSYNLKARYSLEASNGLATLRDTLDLIWEKAGEQGVREHLNATAAGHARRHANAWDTAMYQTLAGNHWYCAGGFREL